MAKRIGRIMALSSLTATVALGLGTTMAWAAAITMSSVRGGPGSTVSVNATLNAGTDMVAGAEMDVAYDPATPFATTQTCLRKSTQTCQSDDQCPVTCSPSTTPCSDDPSKTENEPCVTRPVCTVSSSSVQEEGFFSFIKTPACGPPGCLTATPPCTVECGCTPGTDCTAIRAIVTYLGPNPLPSPTPGTAPPPTIPDGATLMTCNINIDPASPPVGGFGATHPLTVLGPNPSPSPGAAWFSDPDGNSVTAGTSTPGHVVIGCIGDTSNTGEVSPIDASYAVADFLDGNEAPDLLNPAADANFDGSISPIEASIPIFNFLNGACE